MCIRDRDIGADDYTPNPVRLPQLSARIRALIRRAHSIANACRCHDSLTLDTGRHTASVDGQALELTNREGAILEILLMSAPKVVSKDRLVQSLSLIHI